MLQVQYFVNVLLNCKQHQRFQNFLSSRKKMTLHYDQDVDKKREFQNHSNSKIGTDPEGGGGTFILCKFSPYSLNNVILNVLKVYHKQFSLQLRKSKVYKNATSIAHSKFLYLCENRHLYLRPVCGPKTGIPEPFQFQNWYGSGGGGGTFVLCDFTHHDFYERVLMCI